MELVVCKLVPGQRVVNSFELELVRVKETLARLALNIMTCLRCAQVGLHVLVEVEHGHVRGLPGVDRLDTCPHAAALGSPLLVLRSVLVTAAGLILRPACALKR